MPTKLFYFSGTGNTLMLARELARALGDATVEPVTRANPAIDTETDSVGIIFPVYGWGMPKIVRDFVDKLENAQGKYLFAVCTYGGTLFASLKTVEIRLNRKGLSLDAGFGVRMPVNYIPIFTVLPEEKQRRILARATEKLERIAATVKARRKSPVETWKIPIINSLLLRMNSKMVENIGNSDASYRVTDNCNYCGLCARVCPVSNVIIKDGRPTWNHACQFCLACLHWCPQGAIRYGKTPASRGQYHHPDVSIHDIMDQQVTGKKGGLVQMMRAEP